MIGSFRALTLSEGGCQLTVPVDMSQRKQTYCAYYYKAFITIIIKSDHLGMWERHEYG